MYPKCDLVSKLGVGQLELGCLIAGLELAPPDMPVEFDTGLSPPGLYSQGPVNDLK